MPARLVAILLFLLLQRSQAQYIVTENELIRKVEGAKSDSDKIKALGELADYYYAYRLEKSGDSAQQQQLLIAQLSTNRDLVLRALFDNSITGIYRWSNTETFDRALDFLDKGLNYAREQDLYDYEALAYIRKADLLKKRGQYDKAIEEASHAFSVLNNTRNDSLSAVLFLQLGDILLAKDKTLEAYQNYNKAYDIGYDLKNLPLQSAAYRCFASLYYKLQKQDVAESYLLNSVALNRSSGNRRGLLLDYINLARYVEKKEYIDRVLLLAAELKSFRHYMFGKQLMLAYLMVIEKNSAKALDYLHKNEDLKQSYLNRGIDNYYHTIGNIYRYSGQPDSALKYYLLAEPEVKANYETSSQMYYIMEIGTCYKMLNQPEKAIQYLERALSLNRENTVLTTDSTLAHDLSVLYAQIGDYKKALDYQLLYQNSRAALQEMADARQLALLDVEREDKKHQKDLEDIAREKIRQRNIQYMGISIAITILFMLMILIGMFPVSRIMIRMVGFFAFICLFEFIILIIDNYVHHKTHGDALKIWLLKIGIIAILLPLHHLLEHLMVRFLESHKLIKLRQQFSVKRLWHNTKKAPPVEKATTDEATKPEQVPVS